MRNYETLPISRILRIEDCPMGAAGRYKCTTEDDETSCDLTVYLKNKWLKKLENVSLKEGQAALFECQVVVVPYEKNSGATCMYRQSGRRVCVCKLK